MRVLVNLALALEERYGNRYYRIHRPANVNSPIDASLRWTVLRSTVSANGADELSAAERERYLAPNSLVPVGHEILQPILAEIRENRADDSPQATARAIYDWVVDNVEYKKVGTGWVPIDASEAAKHPDKRELFYGTHPADRIHFTTGRDLVLSAGSTSMPLNYFVYPYVEVGGKPWRVKVKTRFSYREIPAS